MKFRYYLIPLGIILACILFAADVRSSYADPAVDLDSYELSVLQSLDTASFPDVDTLLSQSDLVARITFDGSRTIAPDALYSNVTVSKVYRGDANLTGRQLCIVEPLYVFTATKFVNTAPHVYMPLRQGGDYLLLLKKVQFDSARILTDEQKIQYYPATQSVLSVFPVSDTQQTQVLSDGDSVRLGDLARMDIPTKNPSELNFYNKIKSNLFNKFGI